jgi:alkylhydroperoxidase/carboxymuconolactone decarboxylase family protein YurZ
MASQENGREAWVSIPTEAEHRASLPQSARGGNYDFGYLPAMGRLQARHKDIGPLFGALYRQVMFGPGELDRREREMVAAVAAAAQDCRY